MTLTNLSQNNFWCANYTPVTWPKGLSHLLSPFVKGYDIQILASKQNLGVRAMYVKGILRKKG